MEHAAHRMHDDHRGHEAHAHDEAYRATGKHGQSLNHVAAMATVHCLAGCAIGEVAGMAIGRALAWGNFETIALAVALAFVSGYALTMIPLLRAGLPMRRALSIGLAADTVSISIMETVDNAIMLLIPGAMHAQLSEMLFWGSLAVALTVAGIVAYPANRWLIARGKGHAVLHAYDKH